jgi:tetratricopeptide (TPR) repeat protein
MADFSSPSEQLTEAPSNLGARLRTIRTERGLTQTQLAGERFTKEYVSQIERGKTRPSRQTLEWLAERLGVDHEYLETGLAADDRLRGESLVAQAEAAIASERPEEAIALLSGVKLPTPELELRGLLSEGRARLGVGEVREALALLTRARELAEAARFADVDRAEVLYQMGCCRYELSSLTSALALFGEALALAESSGLPCDRLRSQIYERRSRCYRRQRDWEAAREDIERALELAEGLNDRGSVANALFQASLVAERQGHWVLSRSYAERAKSLYEEVADERAVGMLLNNLGGLAFLLGRPEQAVEHLKKAFATAIEVGSQTDAAYAISSLAQVHLKTGRIDLAEEQARQALELLAGRVDLLDEIGNVQLVLGRSLFEQGRLDEAETVLHECESSFDQLDSASHRAAAWIAQGDLAAKRGDDRGAARLYRRAAEALQDFRF